MTPQGQRSFVADGKVTGVSEPCDCAHVPPYLHSSASGSSLFAAGKIKNPIKSNWLRLSQGILGFFISTQTRGGILALNPVFRTFLNGWYS